MHNIDLGVEMSKRVVGDLEGGFGRQLVESDEMVETALFGRRFDYLVVFKDMKAIRAPDLWLTRPPKRASPVATAPTPTLPPHSIR
ncbi:unnamed protein product [Haemonchus placei]|uniref:Site-specific DNA-methyltransferase (adenine-specific) n=1 Tax=Haemonchus placei TaxID=6290 RepID=A0A0N4W8H4_HAEPC|nr:unnamed protein product [Haemonchus placei]